MAMGAEKLLLPLKNELSKFSDEELFEIIDAYHFSSNKLHNFNNLYQRLTKKLSREALLVLKRDAWLSLYFEDLPITFNPQKILEISNFVTETVNEWKEEKWDEDIKRSESYKSALEDKFHHQLVQETSKILQSRGYLK